MWSLGSIVGSALGGFTAQPAKFYPHIFPPDGIFGEYPYLLPNIVSVVAIVIAMIQGWLLLEETNPAAKSRSSAPGPSHSHSHTVDERTPLRHRERRESALTAFSVGAGSFAYAVSSAPLPNDPAFDLRRPSFASITSFKPLSHTMTPTVEIVIEDEELEAPKSDSIKAFNKGVIFWTIALVLMCYHQMAFYALFPIYLLDDPQQPPQHLDLVGGLGLTLPTVGVFLAANSVLSLFVQGVIFPIYVAKFGVWKSVLSLTIVAPIALLLVPFVTVLPNPGIGMCVLLAVQSFTAIIIYPSLLILLKNATESPLVLGRVNGLAMSACSAARTVAPPLEGIFYSGLGSAGAWWSCAVVAIGAIIELCFAPRPKEDDATILRRASMAVEPAPTTNGVSD